MRARMWPAPVQLGVAGSGSVLFNTLMYQDSEIVKASTFCLMTAGPGSGLFFSMGPFCIPLLKRPVDCL